MAANERRGVTKERQFSFKRKHSCADIVNLCLIKSAVDYYLKRGNDKVFVCVLWTYLKPMIECRTTIFYHAILEMGVPVYFVRLLSVWYENQTMHVKWKTQLSEKFTVGKGVRQGSVLLCPSLIFTLRIY